MVGEPGRRGDSGILCKFGIGGVYLGRLMELLRDSTVRDWRWGHRIRFDFDVCLTLL